MHLKNSDILIDKDGVFVLNVPLFAKGVDRLFVQTVANMIEITVIACPLSDKSYCDWSVQFISPRLLEDKYIETLLGESKDEELLMMKHSLREEYLRNRFRSYMNRFQLYRSLKDKLFLQAKVEGNTVNLMLSNEPTLEKDASSSKHIFPMPK